MVTWLKKYKKHAVGLLLLWVALFVIFLSNSINPSGSTELDEIKMTPGFILSEATKGCSDRLGRTQGILCLKEHLEPTIKKIGIRPLIDELSQTFFKDDDVNGGGITRCHDILHAVGQVGGTNSGDINNTLVDCSSLCTFACYHGVIEGYVSRGGNLTEELSRLCRTAKLDGMPAEKSACFHGIGHGIASIAGFELKKSLDLCDRVDVDWRRDCGTGVFMELFEPANFKHPLLEFPQDIPQFCRDIPGEVYKEVCYNTAGVHEYGRSQDMELAITTCNKVEQMFRNNCISALGQNIFYSFNGEASKIYKLCGLVREDTRAFCIYGALEAAVVLDPLVRLGLELCEISDDIYKKSCYNKLGERVDYIYGYEHRRKICSRLRNVEYQICIGSRKPSVITYPNTRLRS